MQQDDSTSDLIAASVADEEIPDEQFTVQTILPDGWTILYNDSASLLIDQHGAVIRCYLALCVMSNGDRSSRPSLETLGERMGGMSRASAKRAVKSLEEIGLLRVVRPTNQGRGTASSYVLTAPPKKGVMHDPHTKKGVTGYDPHTARRGSQAMTPQQVTNGQQGRNKTPHTPQPGTRPVVSDDSSGSGQEPNRAQANKDAPSPSPSPELGTSPEERQAYWRNPKRLTQFDAVYQAYPKEVGRLDAMAAWRQTIADRMDGATPDNPGEVAEVWNGVQRWVAFWRKDETEDRFIPKLANFIRKEQWREAPQGRSK